MKTLGPLTLDSVSADFIETEVSQGHYGTAEDVVVAALRLLQEQEETLAAVRAALLAGEESGISARSVQDIWADVKDRHLRRVS